MQLTDEFASTFEAGDWIEYTDDQGNRLSGTLAVDGRGDPRGSALGLFVSGRFIPVVGEYWPNSAGPTHFFDSYVRKLHSFRRARRRVVVGDRLDGVEERLIVPTATQVRDDGFGLYVWSGTGEWIRVEGTRLSEGKILATLHPDQIRGEVVYVP